MDSEEWMHRDHIIWHRMLEDHVPILFLVVFYELHCALFGKAQVESASVIVSFILKK
jgi:hypothetical protein